MENPEGVLNLLDEFAKVKSKEIPNDLEEYLLYVAASGDPVYQWSLIKSLYRQKLINVITEFYETCPMMDIPPCPNVDPFNYETMKNGLLERLDSFASAPFTIQRISELLTNPRKQYNRVDKFMRAIEKNIWVVSTREPGQREAPAPQENSSNLVNGVAPRVRVTVKHPKRGKSIEERIKSGHPQLIDDDDEEEEEDEQMEVENNAELIANNETDDTPLQCTSVKDLIEKYENGTIFCNAEEKTEFEEKSAQDETGAAAAVAAAAAAAAAAAVVATSSEKENVLTDSETPSEQETEDENGQVNLDKVIPTEPTVEIENVPSEEGKSEGPKNEDANENEEPSEPLIENPKEDASLKVPDAETDSEPAEFFKDEEKTNAADGIEQKESEENSSSNEEQVSVTEISQPESELASNDSEQILEEINSEEAAKVIEPTVEKEEEEKEDEEEEEEKPVTNNENKVAEEKEEEKLNDFNKRKREDEEDSSSKKLGSESRILLELETDWSSSPDDTNLEAPVLSESIDFIDVKEPLFEKAEDKKEMEEAVAGIIDDVKPIETVPETCAGILPETSEAEIVEKASEFTAIEAELCLTNEILESKMDENEEKSNEMIVEESDKIDAMEVDDSCTNSPMAQEEILEPMDDSDAGHS